MPNDDVYNLRELGRGGARLFAVACGYRVAAVVEHFGRRESKRAYDAIMRSLWQHAAGPDIDPKAVAELSRLVEACAEAGIDDPSERGHYAKCALGAVSEAIAALGAESLPSVVSSAQAASFAVLDLMAALNAVTQKGPSGQLSVDAHTEKSMHLQFVKTIALFGGRDVDALRRRSVAAPWCTEFFRQVDAAQGWLRPEA